MTTPTGTISLSDVNVELSKSSTAAISLNDTDVRTLAGVTGSGTTISMDNLRGKSSVTVSLALLEGYYFASEIGNVWFQLQFFANGNFQVSYNGVNESAAWRTPTGTGVGAGYYIRFTLTASGGVGMSASAPSGWNQLSATQVLSIDKTSPGIGFRTYTVEISSSATGSPVLASKSVQIDMEYMQ